MNDSVYEDGQGNLFNDKGMTVAVVEMEERKPPEKPEKTNEKKEDRGDVKLANNTTTRIHKGYKEVEKEQLFALVCEKGMSAKEAALCLLLFATN
ncbi:hypothetical protein MBANPS3_008606 [Mucor bainieri]